MPLHIWQRQVVEPDGEVVPSALVEVRRARDNALAVLYSDRAGETFMPNPFRTDSRGEAKFYAAPGLYRVKATQFGRERVWENVRLGVLEEWIPDLTEYVRDFTIDYLNRPPAPPGIVLLDESEVFSFTVGTTGQQSFQYTIPEGTENRLLVLQTTAHRITGTAATTTQIGVGSADVGDRFTSLGTGNLGITNIQSRLMDRVITTESGVVDIVFNYLSVPGPTEVLTKLWCFDMVGARVSAGTVLGSSTGGFFGPGLVTFGTIGGPEVHGSMLFTSATFRQASFSWTEAERHIGRMVGSVFTPDETFTKMFDSAFRVVGSPEGAGTMAAYKLIHSGEPDFNSIDDLTWLEESATDRVRGFYALYLPAGV